MTAVFARLGRRLSPRVAYAAGFAVYWACWCAAFPLWVLGPQGVRRALRSGRLPGPVDVALLAFPVAGAVGAELLPHRRLVDLRVAAVMLGTAAVNAVGEELLWRGTFLDQFRGDLLRGALWPLTGFTVWHLAPQLVLPSSRGRAGFLLGAAVVGGASRGPAKARSIGNCWSNSMPSSSASGSRPSSSSAAGLLDDAELRHPGSVPARGRPGCDPKAAGREAIQTRVLLVSSGHA
ncbi:hypothetical protein SAMN06273567_104393 [Geodermatophilus aquaeductus]|uniref:CAAX prenyl protease 2/Lysostaphin resistance protein A-like domain-containing protein n=1 Tax=Geodermatophilus aquaeductus TaxID=1564161 RepID=A0A521EC99_9ACTN|nr:CPBP family glutamic-type intramembrane protease [Geodermatophilus aquaeductus]SMO81101.1 hypothetical protein SAMN06273567_104393 [Geodermatophilus aquaeductus]